MSSEISDSSAGAQIRDIIDRLQLPIPDTSTLLPLLTAPLDSLGLLPPQFRKYNTNPLPAGALVISRHMPPLQRALLAYIIPTWDATLTEENNALLFEQYFCPDSFTFASTAAGEVALLAYSSILSLPLREASIRLLARMTKEYPIDRLHSAVFSLGVKGASSKRDILWEDCVRNVVAVPVKVANAAGGKLFIPPSLEQGNYFNHVSVRCECLISSASRDPSGGKITSIVYIITKLVKLGLFPPSPPTILSQPSFFQSTLPIIRRRLQVGRSTLYSTFWSNIFDSLSSSFTLQAVLTSLFSSLHLSSADTDVQKVQRGTIKREAGLLRTLVGSLSAQSTALWESASAVMLTREWTQNHGRTFVCWAAGVGDEVVDEVVNVPALEIFLTKVLDMWSSPEHIKYSLLSRHQYLTSLLLIAVSYFPPSSPNLLSLALSPNFIAGIGIYVGHRDGSVRRCGMLAAEVVAQYAGKKLDFGDWEGDNDGKPWARMMRQRIRERDIDADTDTTEDITEAREASIDEEVTAIGAKQDIDMSKPNIPNTSAGYDSDDSLTGYASPTSARSSSPTPSELDAIEKDPTLNVGSNKIARPVYLAQLGEMLRSSGGLKVNDDNQEADKIEIALSCAEELIRKKKGYGTELEENAVNLVYGLVGLQDNYDLDGFEMKRQSALNALVACCPQKAAPSVIEEFFKNQYSTGQRYVMLNALAIGARELASLPIPQSVPQTISSDRTSFPSKILPGRVHDKYLTAGDQTSSVVNYMLDDISRTAIDRRKDDSVDKVPQLVRERRLRIHKPPQITSEQGRSVSRRSLPYQLSPSATFTEVAAEIFIAPLINRFWLFLRDEQTREERTARHETLYQYRSAGTGLILNAVVLAHFLSTLAVLVHASQNAPEWLAVAAPEALELAVTLGSRPISQRADEGAEDQIEGVSKGKEAFVLTAALELALIILDGCLELDGGRSLGLDHTTLLLGTGEWAGRVFSQLEKGVRVEGGGGAQEVKLRRAAAGVVLKVDELTSKWRRSMIDIT